LGDRLREYKIGELVIAQREDGEKFVAMIASKGYESSRHVMDRPVKILSVTNYRCLAGDGIRYISDNQIIKAIRRKDA